MACWRKKRERKSDVESKRGAMLLKDLIECCDGKSNPIKFFSADDILKATNHFSESNRIYKVFGYYWFSGKNENHNKILIKKYYRSQLRRYFYRDVAISSMVSGHKNFLKLVGCCLELEDSAVMVYHDVKKHYELDLKEQPWNRRMKIAEDIATALAYLHTAFPRPFIYRSLSLESILLDEDGVAKLKDFSYCVSIPKGETFVQVDSVAGTVGYIDVKYHRSLVVSEETDIFAIGMMMQRLLTGIKRYNEFLYKDGYQFLCSYEFQIRLAKFVEEQRMDEIVDPEIGEISEEELSQMKALLILSQRCKGCRGEVPKMVEVAKELKKIQRSLTNNSSYPFAKTHFYSYSPISCRSSPEIVSPR